MDKNFYFTFHPSQERDRKNGRATHYLRNQGIVTFDEELVDYFYRCRVYNKRPELYGQGWYNKRENVFNAGFAIPRNSRLDQFLEHQQPYSGSTLASLFEDEPK